MSLFRPAALLLVALLALPAARAQEKPPPPPIAVATGVGLGVDPSDPIWPRATWVPVWVALENKAGSRRVELEVLLRHTGELRQTRSLDLPAGQSRREWFVLPLAGSATWEVSLRDEATGEQLHGSGQQAIQSLPWQYQRSDVLRLLELTPRGQDRAEEWLPGLPRGVHRRATPEQLPDLAWGWRDLDVVAIREFDLGALSTAQLESLRVWLEDGGQLLLAPGDRLGWLDLPATRRLTGDLGLAIATGSLLGLVQSQGGPAGASDRELLRRPVRLLRAGAAVDPGLVRLDSGRVWPVHGTLPEGGLVPLVQVVRRGRGAVHLLAFDPGLGAFQDWRGRDEAIRDLHDWLVHFAASTRRPDIRPEDRDLAALVDSRRRPAIWPALLVLVAFVACVGPLNGWLLRRREAQPLLVLTVPALSLLFGALVFGLGALLRGATLTCWRASVLQGNLEAGTLHERSLTGVLTGVSGQARLELDATQAALRLPPLRGGAWRELLEIRSAERGPGTAELKLRAWEPACFAGEGFRAAGQGVSLAWKEGVPSLTNGTPWPLVGSALLTGEDLFQADGPIAPGATAPLPRRAARPRHQLIELALAGLSQGEPTELDLARKLLQRFELPRGRLQLLARLPASPGGAAVEGRVPDLDLALLALGGE